MLHSFILTYIRAFVHRTLRKQTQKTTVCVLNVSQPWGVGLRRYHSCCLIFFFFFFNYYGFILSLLWYLLHDGRLVGSVSSCLKGLNEPWCRHRVSLSEVSTDHYPSAQHHGIWEDSPSKSHTWVAKLEHSNDNSNKDNSNSHVATIARISRTMTTRKKHKNNDNINWVAYTH